MRHQNLPRVTYSNIGSDFAPLHDMLDTAIPAFKKSLGKSRPNVIANEADRDGESYLAHSPIDKRVVLGEFVEASVDAIERDRKSVV